MSTEYYPDECGDGGFEQIAVTIMCAGITMGGIMIGGWTGWGMFIFALCTTVYYGLALGCKKAKARSNRLDAEAQAAADYENARNSEEEMV